MSNATPPTELPPRYAAADVQAEVAAVWERENLFHAEPSDPGEPFSVVIPPPNVTAALHLGHALNNTLQDVLTRHGRGCRGRTPSGCPAPTTRASPPRPSSIKRLQAAGEKSLKDYKLQEADSGGGRVDFIEKVQSLERRVRGKRITQQAQGRWGAAATGTAQAFTMDEPRAKAVREAFFRLFKDGLIYRGKRLVNWDPVTQTALADDEVENARRSTASSIT